MVDSRRVRLYTVRTLGNEAREMAKAKITAKKYMGDCPNSWAVFIDGQPRYTGLCKREVAYYKKRALQLCEKG